MGVRQNTAWGHIEWLTDSQNTMSVGVVTILGNMHQEQHVHYENEQFIYIIGGHGREYINGELHRIEPGMYYHLPANITHETINEGDEPIVHLMASVSTTVQEISLLSDTVDENTSHSFYGALEAIRTQVMEQTALPVTIFDDMGNIALQNERFSPFCIKHCNPTEKPAQCECLQHIGNKAGSAGNVGTACPHGLTVFQMPILYKDHYLGSIISGHVRLGGRVCNQEEGVYDTPDNTMLAIQKWMIHVSKSIVGYCSFDSFRRSLNQKDILIQQKQRDSELLEADLKTMRNQVTNLRINRHFLFNTLNAIAGQALTGDRMTTYQTLIDLSKMFRYTTNNDTQMVPLRSEVEYLNTYLHLQQLRYGRDLTISCNIPEELLSYTVPFNFLQPVVENAFTHGFVDFDEQKCLELSISEEGDRLCFRIRNNGIPVDNITLHRVSAALRSNSGHGLSLIYSKLSSVYGEEFSLEIKSDSDRKTIITIQLPKTKEKKLQTDAT